MSGASGWSAPALLNYSAFKPILLMLEDEKEANVIGMCVYVNIIKHFFLI